MEQRAHCTRCFFCQKWTPCWSSRSRIIGLRDVVQLMRYKPKSIAAKPMRLTLPVSCAKPASGHDAAPPSSVMKRVKTVRSGKRSLGSVLREAFSGKRSAIATITGNTFPIQGVAHGRPDEKMRCMSTQRWTVRPVSGAGSKWVSHDRPRRAQHT